jgi:hypothetical protein
MSSFDPLPPATPQEAADILRHMLAQVDERYEAAIRVAASITLQKRYLARALEGVEAKKPEDAP